MNKLKSRRFWVFIIWTVFMGISIFVTKTVMPEMVSWYGIISMLYIGSSVAKSAIFEHSLFKDKV